jgi:hypothetical protein
MRIKINSKSTNKDIDTLHSKNFSLNKEEKLQYLKTIRNFNRKFSVFALISINLKNPCTYNKKRCNNYFNYYNHIFQI